MQAFTESLRDRYVLERELGRGGMAVVYLARDVKHDRPVALKVLNPDAGLSLGAERFQREIRLAASLQHPHVLSVHDSGETAGRLWFTMPYVRGESLRDRLRRDGTLPIQDAIRITLEAAQALAHAHKQRIVHRDVKPENILLTEDGATLVADFGIARTLDGPQEQELTVTGVIVGTPKYMPPEQLTGGGDARIDQYALAETCFEMLTGNPPFSTSGARLPTNRRIGDPIPDVRQLRPEVPTGVQYALERALAFDPHSRFPSMAEFGKALEAGRTGSSLAQPAAAGTPGRKYARWAAAAILLGVIGALGASVLGRRPASSAGDATTAAPGDTAVRRVVVLPFENEGNADDTYFADGMADEVRGKLASVQGLEVIARASSSQYARTTKSPQRIGEELGVAMDSRLPAAAKKPSGKRRALAYPPRRRNVGRPWLRGDGARARCVTPICRSSLRASTSSRTSPSRRSISSRRRYVAATSIHAAGCESMEPLPRCERTCDSSVSSRAARLPDTTVDCHS